GMRGIAFPIWSRASAGGAPAPRRPAARTSLAVELDDELLGDRDLDVVAQRQASDDALLLVRIELQPLGHLPAAGVDVIVDSRLQFRLLAQLHAERGQLAAVQSVLARRIVTPLDRALVGEAAGTLQEELHPFASAQPALRVAIPRHGRPLHPPPLRRAAAVVRYRRHVA